MHLSKRDRSCCRPSIVRKGGEGFCFVWRLDDGQYGPTLQCVNCTLLCVLFQAPCVMFGHVYGGQACEKKAEKEGKNLDFEYSRFPFLTLNIQSSKTPK